MNSDLLQICQQLHAKGISPSVALLRAKSTRSVPLQEAIKTIQEWGNLRDSQPDGSLNDFGTSLKNTVKTSDEIASIETRLSQLEHEVAELRELLTQLKN